MKTINGSLHPGKGYTERYVIHMERIRITAFFIEEVEVLKSSKYNIRLGKIQYGSKKFKLAGSTYVHKAIISYSILQL